MQAVVIFPPDSIVSRAGESEAQVSLTPLDVRAVPPPTSSVRFDGNAYRLEAIYAASRQSNRAPPAGYGAVNESARRFSLFQKEMGPVLGKESR